MSAVHEGKCTEGGWEDFIRNVKSLVDTDKQLDYSLLMSLYIHGIKAEEAILILKSSTNKGEKR